jgi:hypothetical protein
MCFGPHRKVEYPECVPWCGRHERVEAYRPCPPKQRGDLACPVPPWERKAKITGLVRRRGFCARHRHLDRRWREKQEQKRRQHKMELARLLLRMEAEDRIRGANGAAGIFAVIDWQAEEEE